MRVPGRPTEPRSFRHPEAGTVEVRGESVGMKGSASAPREPLTSTLLSVAWTHLHCTWRAREGSSPKSCTLGFTVGEHGAGEAAVVLPGSSLLVGSLSTGREEARSGAELVCWWSGGYTRNKRQEILT